MRAPPSFREGDRVKVFGGPNDFLRNSWKPAMVVCVTLNGAPQWDIYTIRYDNFIGLIGVQEYNLRPLTVLEEMVIGEVDGA